MNRTLLPRLVAALAAPLLLAGASSAADTPPAAADTVQEALTKGKLSVNLRGRYEHVEQTGLRDADALTLRSRIGYTTAPIQGWKAMLEAENTTALDGDAYSQAGLNPGGAGRAVVADPEDSELNQAWISYTKDKTVATLGRQRLVLDNVRFIGDVGWRQNMQTFDAFTVQDKTVDKLTLTYGYFYQVNRVFTDRHAQGDWDSDSHIVNASYAGLPIGTLTGYAYLLDFDNAAANSSATYGLSLVGAKPVSDKAKVSYRAEYAYQTDYASSALNYSTDYLLGEVGLAFGTVSGAIGYEVLGTDNGVGFKTPLATLHAFNGWADMFLATPAGGLRDVYGKVGATLPGGVGLLAFYHQFETDLGADLGDEIDLQASFKLSKYLTGLVKYAAFDSDSVSFADVDKFWAQIEFNF